MTTGRQRNHPNTRTFGLFNNGQTPSYKTFSCDENTKLSQSVGNLYLAINSQNSKRLKSILSSPHSIDLLTPDDEGMTPLHLAIQTGNFEIYKLIIDALNTQKQTALACRKINNAGELPIKFLLPKDYEHPLNSQQKQILNHLLTAMINTEKYLKPSQEPISLEEVMKENAEVASKNPKLKDNLVFSVLAANILRKNIKECSTHPECHQFSKARVKKITDKCRAMRFKYQVENSQNWFEVHSDDKSLSNLETIFKMIKKTAAGKCYEYAAALMHILITVFKEQGINTRVEHYETNGDHVFVVIGRKAGSDSKNFDDWGPEAVVVDALAGTVFPANKIPEKLRDFYCYTIDGRLRQFTYPFQLNYHSLQPVVTSPIILSDTFFNSLTKKTKESDTNQQKLSKAMLSAVCYQYTTYKNEWLGLRWFRCSSESCDAVDKLKAAKNDEDRYIIAIAYINQHPNKAFAKTLAKMMNYAPMPEPIPTDSYELPNLSNLSLDNCLNTFLRRTGLPRELNPFRCLN